jgi:hypothetical protein
MPLYSYYLTHAVRILPRVHGALKTPNIVEPKAIKSQQKNRSEIIFIDIGTMPNFKCH